MKQFFATLTLLTLTLSAYANDHRSLDAQDIGWNSFSREHNETLCDINFRQNPATTKNAKVALKGTNYMHFNGFDFQNLQFNGSHLVVETKLQIDPAKKTYLNLDHCSTIVDHIPSSKVTITVNGEEVIKGFNPLNGGNFRQQHLDITDYVQSGYNNIRITVDDDSVSRYWIATFSIYQQ